MYIFVKDLKKGQVDGTEVELRYKQELEHKLREQQKQSEEDSRWLAEEENNLVSLYDFFFHNGTWQESLPNKLKAQIVVPCHCHCIFSNHRIRHNLLNVSIFRFRLYDWRLFHFQENTIQYLSVMFYIV
jgi:hypothetical protein